VSSPANRHDSPLLAPTLDNACELVRTLPEEAIVHLDRGYDSVLTRQRLEQSESLWQKSPKRANPHRLGQRGAG
jgi:hypothetical protein